MSTCHFELASKQDKGYMNTRLIESAVQSKPEAQE
jgi:hypothetical protein